MGHERADFPSSNREPPRLDGTGAMRSAPVGDGSKRERDWKRSVLIAGLGILSWVATYVGMLELIEANMGDLPLVHKLIIGFSVAMLMIMIIWLLDQLFKPHAFVPKLFYAFGYVFLSLISVGFGFGFYWKVLESRGEASRSAESAVGSVQSSLHAASTRLEQLQATLVQLTQVSSEKSEIERVKGTSCPNSKPGDGPRRKMREEDAQRFQFTSEFVKGRVSTVKGDLSALNDDMIRIVSDDPSLVDPKSGTRNEFMRSLSRKLDLTVTGFNAFRTDPQLKQMRADLADRAERTTFPDNRGGTFVCPDPQLQTALRGVVKAIDQLPDLEKPQIAAVEGSEATIEAFRRLTATFQGLLSFKLPPSADELRELQKKAIQSVEAPTPAASHFNAEQGGLSKRDYVPLAVALFVDLCLFLVSMVQAPRSRLSGLMPKMQAAERGPVIDILSRFKDIHGDEEIRQNFEIFRHVVFDMNGDYYVAVPLDAPPRLNPAEREALRVEAQLLANLFASFEKEKIFKRTLLPTTGSIQKRLKRQGSKFATSEAFRVYKFTDGAWSDIILGAIMGAAKRAENEKRIFPAAAHLRPRPAGELDVAAAAPALAGAMRPGLADASISSKPSLGQGSGQGPARTPATREPRPAYQPAHQMAPTFSRPATAPPPMSRPPVPNRDTASTTRPEHLRAVPAAAGSYDGDASDHARGGLATGPVIEPSPPQAPRIARPLPPLPEAEVIVTRPSAAPHAAAPAPAPVPPVMATAPADRSAVVVPLPRPAALEKADSTPSNEPPRLQPLPEQSAAMVDVTLARETATFSVPLADAMSPASLKAALTKAVTPQAPPKTDAPVYTYDLVPLEELANLEDEDVKIEPLSARDMAIISRMAPPAAE